MSMDAALSRFPECPYCWQGVDENDSSRPYTVINQEYWHSDCLEAGRAAETESERLMRRDDDLPFDQMHGDSEDLKESPIEDEGFRVVYSDEDIDQMEKEQRTVEIRPIDTFFSADLPMKPGMARTFQLLEEMYEHTDGTPLKTHYTESLAVLHLPRSVRRKSHDEQVSS